MAVSYAHTDLLRAEVDGFDQPVLLEFGTNWCGICSAAQPTIEDALGRHTGLRHIKVEDGPGRPLGRSFRVKLWPTLILVSGGREVARVVRPSRPDEIDDMLRQQEGGTS